MLLDSLSTIGGVVTGITLILVLVYTVLSAEQRKPAGNRGQSERHSPVVDEDLLYLTSSIYPYPEYSYFPVLAFSTEPQAVVQSTPPMLHAPVLPLYRERQEAIQPA